MTSYVGTTYFSGEGRESLEACVDCTMAFCGQHGIRDVVMLTGSGEGALYALKNYLVLPRFSGIRLIAITPPAGRVYREDPNQKDSRRIRAGIFDPAMKRVLSDGGIAIHAAH